MLGKGSRVGSYEESRLAYSLHRRQSGLIIGHPGFAHVILSLRKQLGISTAKTVMFLILNESDYMSTPEDEYRILIFKDVHDEAVGTRLCCVHP